MLEPHRILASQVLTGESWSEVVARPVVMSRDHNILGTFFYITFMVRRFAHFSNTSLCKS